MILCTGNSARSQIAEGILRNDGGEAFEVYSAGVKASAVRPEAIQAMREIGIDISGHRSKLVDEFTGQEFDYVHIRTQREHRFAANVNTNSHSS